MTPHCLLVEHDLETSRLFMGQLVARGYEVSLARTRWEAMRALFCDQYDLILLDLDLPSGQAAELAGIAGFRQPDCPVILLTDGAGMPRGEARDALEAASAIFRKTPRMQELLAFAAPLAAAEPPIQLAY